MGDVAIIHARSLRSLGGARCPVVLPRVGAVFSDGTEVAIRPSRYFPLDYDRWFGQDRGRKGEVTMAVWSVQIVPGTNPGAPAVFVAQNQPTAPPGTLYADPNDAVSWDNTTASNHELQTTSSPVTPLGGLVTPGHQTSAWIVTGNAGAMISYACLIHPQEKGTIAVT